MGTFLVSYNVITRRRLKGSVPEGRFWRRRFDSLQEAGTWQTARRKIFARWPDAVRVDVQKTTRVS